MADNTELSAGTGGDTLRDKDRAGVKTPIVAIDLNPAGSETLMAGTMPVTQSGTWTVQPGNTANTTAWKVDGSAVTQPISGTVTANAGTGTFTVSGTVAATQSGTWNVGTVTTVTTVSAVTAITNPLPAGTNLLGKVAASHETGTVYNGTTALTPKFAAISASSSGDNTVVAAVTSKKIRVLRWSLSSNGSVNAKWKSATAGDITGLRYLTQYASAGGAYCPVGLFETTAGEGLVLNLSGAVAVGGELTYLEV